MSWEWIWELWNILDRTEEKIPEEKNMKETFEHEDFTKYARKTTKLHLIASIRGTGKVDMLAKGDCHNFLGVPIDGMGEWTKKGGSRNCSKDLAITELECYWLPKKLWRLALRCLGHETESLLPQSNW